MVSYLYLTLQCWQFVVSQLVITETDCTFLSQLKETEKEVKTGDAIF